MSSFEKENYKESFEYYLKVLDSRENDISAKFGAGISAFKNQDIETGMKYLQEVSNSEDEILSSRAHFNLANIYKDENKLEESLYHYKKAIELNSKDRDSKINYELLKKMLSQEDQESQSNQAMKVIKAKKIKEAKVIQAMKAIKAKKIKKVKVIQAMKAIKAKKIKKVKVIQAMKAIKAKKIKEVKVIQAMKVSQEDQESQSKDQVMKVKKIKSQK